MRNQAQLVGKASSRAESAPRPDASRVSADMEGIFGAAQPEGAGEAPRGADGIVPIIPRQARHRRSQPRAAPAWAAGAVLVLAGAAWLALALERDGSAPTRAPAVTDAVAPIRPAQTAAPAAVIAAVARPAPPPAAARLASTEADAGTPPAVSPKPAPAPRRSAASARPKPAATPPATERVVRPQADASCSGLSRLERAHCMRPQVLDADAELRRAYASATQAGVSPRMLKSYNRRWARALEKSVSDPEAVTRKLRSMARKLEAERLARAEGL